MLMVYRLEVYIILYITWVFLNFVLGLNFVIIMFVNMYFLSFILLNFPVTTRSEIKFTCLQSYVGIWIQKHIYITNEMNHLSSNRTSGTGRQKA